MPDVQPTNNPVPSDHPADARDNFKRIDEVVNLQSPQSSPTRTGKRLNTLYGLEQDYLQAIQQAGGVPLSDGVWTAGQTFTSYNQFMIFNNVPYRPLTSTTLPYGPTGSSPDPAFVGPYESLNLQSAAKIFINPNLISNSGFEIPGSVANHPNSTPRAYNAGDELFAGHFALGSLTGVTYIDGVLNGTGQLYVDIPKSQKQQDSTSPVTPSIADSDGLPKTGATVVDNGTSWRVTYDMSNTFSVKLEQGGTSTTHNANQGESASKLRAIDFGIVSGEDNRVNLQKLQDLSSSKRVPIDFSGVSDISWAGVIYIDDWFEWQGSGRFENTLKPMQILRSEISGDSVIAKRNASVDLNHFLMQDLGIDLGYAGPSSPTVDQLVSMIRITANGSNDGDITYLRCHFKNPAHECTVHNVATTSVGVSSGGKIDGIRMLFCSGDVSDLSLASRNANMFKTIHGSIDQPGAYGEYPITDVVSFGNKCRGMRTLADFKRGTADFSHNESYVEDMTDVASISVDGVIGGSIGPDNRGKQTASAANTKNFYEVQGVDVEVFGGNWDCNSQPGAVAAVLVTDYAYPAETTGSYNANQSVNVNIHGFTAKNIPFHAVRLINTKDCDARGIIANNCTLDGVSFEFATGKLDISGDSITPLNNSVDRVKTDSCRFSVSAATENDVSIGAEISDENDVYNIQLIGVASQPYRASFTAEELNINPRGENYGSGDPIRWSGSATATVSTASPPFGSVIKLILEDINPAAIQTFGPSTKTALSQNQALYFSVMCRLDTSVRCSILVQEFTSGDSFVSSNFIPLGATASFELRQRKFECTNATTAYVIVSLVPAGDSGLDSSLIGTSEFANFKISTKLT